MDFNRLLYFFEHFKMCVCFVSCFDYCISFGFIRILNHIVCSYINCKKKLQIKWIESKHNHKIAFLFNKTFAHWTEWRLKAMVSVNYNWQLDDFCLNLSTMYYVIGTCKQTRKIFQCFCFCLCLYLIKSIIIIELWIGCM